MKRLLAFVVLLVPLCLSACGCGGCSSATGSKKVIVVEPPTGEKLQKMMEAQAAQGNPASGQQKRPSAGQK